MYSIGLWLAVGGITVMILYLLYLVLHSVRKTGKSIKNSTQVTILLGYVPLIGLILMYITKVIEN